MDNVSWIIICFENFFTAIKGKAKIHKTDVSKSWGLTDSDKDHDFQPAELQNMINHLLTWNSSNLDQKRKILNRDRFAS